MQILKLRTKYAGIVNTEVVLRELEAHRIYLLEHPKTKVMTIDTFNSYRHQGSLTEFLDSLIIPRRYHSVISMLNKWKTGSDIKEGIEMVIMPDYGVVDSILKLIQTKKI